MLGLIDQARKASMTKAESENQKYSQATGENHPAYQNILDTINRKNTAFGSYN